MISFVILFIGAIVFFIGFKKKNKNSKLFITLGLLLIALSLISIVFGYLLNRFLD